MSLTQQVITQSNSTDGSVTAFKSFLTANKEAVNEAHLNSTNNNVNYILKPAGRIAATILFSG